MLVVYKVIEYIVDLSRSCVGEVPDGTVIKIFKGESARQKATKLRDKLNEAELQKSLSLKREDTIKSYYIKGDLNFTNEPSI